MGDLETRLQAVLGDAFRLERELGGGGMSRVFVAQETGLGRRVVVKVLPPELAAGLNVDRFRREVALAAGLQHPHIVPLHAAGEGEGLFYYTMPLVEGESLRTRLAREGELPIGEVVRLLRDVVDCLAYAHRHGVVHRDIKPDNVLVTSQHAVVTDFGVAKALSDSSGIITMTAEGFALGTPAYMAPEQAAADPNVDHRADLYAVGAMAYEMLTGRPPFTGLNPQAVLAAHVTTTPAPVTQARATVPAALEALVMRCLEKKPADRWQSADELLAQLEAMATPSGGLAPTRATAAPPVGARRKPWHLVATAAAVVLVLGIGAWAVARLGARNGRVGSGPPRLAVLPMENLGTPDDEDLADGLTEEMAGKLAQISGLAVVGRTSVMQYKKAPKSIAEIGQELRVSHVLTSTLRRERGGGTPRLRVHAELVRTGDATQVWAQSYETTGGELFAVQADLAERVARALEVTLLAPEQQALAARPTRNAEAYDHYIRGQAHFARSDDQAAVRSAIESFGQAARIDPGFAAAEAWLSIVHLEMYWFGFDPSSARRDTAGAALERAAAIAPDLPEVRVARGYFRYWGYLDYAGALEELTRALAARPNDPGILAATAYVRRRRGDWDEAVRLLEQIVELDPQSREGASALADTYLILRRFSDAGRYLEQAHALSPTDGSTILALARLALAEGGPAAAREAYHAAVAGRDPAEAARALVQWEPLFLADFVPEFQDAMSRVDLSPELGLPASYHLVKGTAAAQRGRAAEARASFDSALASAQQEVASGPASEAIRSSHLAQAFAGLGRWPEAVREAERATAALPPSRDAIGGASQLMILATIYLRAGQAEKAIEVLHQLLQIPSEISIPRLRNDPTWDPIRKDPGFQRLLQEER
jgi:serine/threonine-protein kinase